MAILAEFGAVAVEWTAMRTRSQPVDNGPRDELEVANAGQKKWIEYRWWCHGRLTLPGERDLKMKKFVN